MTLVRNAYETYASVEPEEELGKNEEQPASTEAREPRTGDPRTSDSEDLWGSLAMTGDHKASVVTLKVESRLGITGDL